MKESKSCIVNFCPCSFTDVFRGLRASFLPSSYFSINPLVTAGKILFNRRRRQAKIWNKYTFQMQVMRSTRSFLNGIGAKSWKYVGSGCSPAPSAVKNNLLVMLVDTSANVSIEFTNVKILLFISLVLLFKYKYH